MAREKVTAAVADKNAGMVVCSRVLCRPV